MNIKRKAQACARAHVRRGDLTEITSLSTGEFRFSVFISSRFIGNPPPPRPPINHLALSSSPERSEYKARNERFSSAAEEDHIHTHARTCALSGVEAISVCDFYQRLLDVGQKGRDNLRNRAIPRQSLITRSGERGWRAFVSAACARTYV